MQEWRSSTEEVAGVDFVEVDNGGEKAQEVDNDGVDFTELS